MDRRNNHDQFGAATIALDKAAVGPALCDVLQYISSYAASGSAAQTTALPEQTTSSAVDSALFRGLQYESSSAAFGSAGAGSKMPPLVRTPSSTLAAGAATRECKTLAEIAAAMLARRRCRSKRDGHRQRGDIVDDRPPLPRKGQRITEWTSRAEREGTKPRVSQSFKADMTAASWARLTPLVIGISGATKAGKTTLAERLSRFICGDDVHRLRRQGKSDRVDRFEGLGRRVSIIGQDSYFLSPKHFGGVQPCWDDSASLDHERLLLALRREAQTGQCHLIILEGFRAFLDHRIVENLDILLWIHIPEETCRSRKMKRHSFAEQQFQQDIWYYHVAYEKMVMQRPQSPHILDGTRPPHLVREQALTVIRSCAEHLHFCR